MKLKKNAYKFTIAFIILGIALSLQFRSIFIGSKQSSAGRLDTEKLITQIQAGLETEKQLKAEINQNLELKANLIKGYISDSQNDAILREWDSIMLKSNLTSVQGPGVEIKLDDAAARVNEDPSLLIIHDSDIRLVLNDLKKAGAQAISINDERITAVSEQVCAGPTIRINNNRYSVPYIIKAIGDPDKLALSIEQSERVVLMKKDNIRVDVKKDKTLIIPAFNNVNTYISGLEAVKDETR